MNNLLPSVEREYKEKIKQLQNEKEAIGGLVLIEVTGCINRADFITEEQKTMLLNLVWKGRVSQHED